MFYPRGSCYYVISLEVGYLVAVLALEFAQAVPRMPDTTHSNGTTFSAESYFETQPGPSTLQADINGVSHFINRQIEEGRKVVLVTVNWPLTQIYVLILQSG